MTRLDHGLKPEVEQHTPRLSTDAMTRRDAPVHTSPETQVFVSMTRRRICRALEFARGQLIGARRPVVKELHGLLQHARRAIARQLTHDGRQSPAAQNTSLLSTFGDIIWQFNGDRGHDKLPRVRQWLMSLLHWVRGSTGRAAKSQIDGSQQARGQAAAPKVLVPTVTLPDERQYALAPSLARSVSLPPKLFSHNDP